MKSKIRKKIIIICFLDGFANSIRPVEVKKFLETRGHEVTLQDTFSLERMSKNKESLLHKLPGLTPLKISLYFIRLLSHLQQKYFPVLTKHIYYYFLIANMKLRAQILKNILKR